MRLITLILVSITQYFGVKLATIEADRRVSGLYLYQLWHSMWLLCVRGLGAPRLRCHSNHWTFLESGQQEKKNKKNSYI